MNSSIPGYPKVLQVIAPAPFGGAESVVRTMAREYPQTRLVALIQQGGSHPFVEESKGEGLDIVQVSGGRRRYDIEAKQVGALIDEYRPDVVHSHIYHADFVCYLAARKRGVPVVTTVHGITGGDWKDRTYQWLDLKLIRRFDGVICVSESVRQQVLQAGIAADRVHVVANPYSVAAQPDRARAEQTLGIPIRRPMIGWVGRLSIEKGADLFIQAIAQLPQPRPLAVIVGGGPEQERVQRLINEYGVQDDVALLGERPGAGALIPAFDALVISSRSEGLPMVLLEAMGANVPVAAFAVGGIPDAINETSGWLAQPGEVTALARAIGGVLSDAAAAARRTAAAHRVLHERYGAQQWTDRLAAAYRAALLSKTSARPVRGPAQTRS